MNATELKNRTFKFSIDIINLIEKLQYNNVNQVIGKQLLRAATSVGANYRSACKARSNKDFISKITIVEEEADECIYWLQLLKVKNAISEIDILEKEATELTAIFTASGKTAKMRK